MLLLFFSPRDRFCFTYKFHKNFLCTKRMAKYWWAIFLNIFFFSFHFQSHKNSELILIYWVFWEYFFFDISLNGCDCDFDLMFCILWRLYFPSQRNLFRKCGTFEFDLSIIFKVEMAHVYRLELLHGFLFARLTQLAAQLMASVAFAYLMALMFRSDFVYIKNKTKCITKCSKYVQWLNLTIKHKAAAIVFFVLFCMLIAISNIITKKL